MEMKMSHKELTKDRINLLESPDIPGMSFRRFRGEEDYGNILKVISGSKEADGIERSDTLENIALYYSHLHNCDPYQDMIFAEVNGEVVGYGRVEWNMNSDGELLGFHLAFLLPAWRRRGIGRAILRHNEGRLREIVGQLREKGNLPEASRCFFEVSVQDSEVGKEALFLKEGYKPVRYEFDMVRPLSEEIHAAEMPAGLEVRPALPEHYRAIWDASQEAFRDHWNFIPAPEQEYQKWTLDPTFRPELWQVAWDGDQVAGMVLNFIHEDENAEYNRKRGYTEGISVRRPWRRRGLARALLTRSLIMFRDMGMEEAALGVDSQNLSGALRLYESVGFRPVKKWTNYRKRFA
jgi:mycothiol synthase